MLYPAGPPSLISACSAICDVWKAVQRGLVVCQKATDECTLYPGPCSACVEDAGCLCVRPRRLLGKLRTTGRTAAVARPLLVPREAGVVTGVVPGLGVTTGMGVCGVSAPVLGSSLTPEEPPISAGCSVCPGPAVCPGVTCSHHIDFQIRGPIAGSIACAGCEPCLLTS